MPEQPLTQEAGERETPLPGDATQHSRTLTATGVTLLGVLLSIGTTVGFGISGPPALRFAVGLSCTLLLTGVVKIATRNGRGPLARLATWMISAPPPD